VPENRELRAQRQRAGLSRHSAAAFPAGVIDLLAVIVARLDADKIIAENPLFAFGSESGLCALGFPIDPVRTGKCLIST
jgi:hypothetical protein